MRSFLISTLHKILLRRSNQRGLVDERVMQHAWTDEQIIQNFTQKNRKEETTREKEA